MSGYELATAVALALKTYTRVRITMPRHNSRASETHYRGDILADLVNPDFTILARRLAQRVSDQSAEEADAFPMREAYRLTYR